MKIGIIGVGKMGGAMARGILRANLVTDGYVYLFDHHESNLRNVSDTYPHVVVCQSEHEVLEKSDIVILAVKPYAICSVLGQLHSVQNRPLMISVAAGITLQQMQSSSPSESRLVRAMPNTPASIGHGVTVYTMGDYTSEQDRIDSQRIFETLGYTRELPEAKINAAMAISGCGPAYMYVILDSLSEAGVALGLSREEALQFASSTMAGAAQMQLQTKAHPMVLRDEVTSPGGVTIAALNQLDALGLRHALIQATKTAGGVNQ